MISLNWEGSFWGMPRIATQDEEEEEELLLLRRRQGSILDGAGGSGRGDQRHRGTVEQSPPGTERGEEREVSVSE